MKHEAEQIEIPAVEAVCPVPPAKHHKFGMSKLNALAACPGYVSREGTSAAAEDGTRLHEIMEKVCAFASAHLEKQIVPDAEVIMTNVLCALPQVIPDDEQFYIKFCCDELGVWLAKNPIKVLTEEKIEILNPDGSQLNYGTGDLLLFLSDEVAVIFDWKFGWIPVPPAISNFQGKGYTVGTFQKYPKLKKIAVIFCQPKLGQVTRATYSRDQLYDMYAEIKGVITAAGAENKTLRPCQYCDFCAVSGTCSALLNEANRAVAIHEQLPMPEKFIGLQIQTPEEAARALYVLSRLEILIEQSGLKDRAKELARANGGTLSCTLPDGSQVIVEMKQRNSPRSANSPMLIAEALKEVLTTEQVLSACDPKITRLEQVFADAYIEKTDAEAKKILAEAEVQAAAAPEKAAEVRAIAKVKAKEIRTTKKHAVEILNDVLLSEGCVTAPEGKVDYLKMRVEKPIKQIQ